MTMDDNPEDRLSKALERTADPVTRALKWHYDSDGRMRCDDCGFEVYRFEEGDICSGCDREGQDG